MRNKALFIDRDGIFNELIFRDGNYHSPRDWNEIKHYSMEGIQKVKELGFKLLMVTNQPDIERKIIQESFINELHSFYQKNYQLDKVYLCPFSSDTHPLKKPNPGMFHLAEKDFDLDLSKSFLLGDTERDTLAASRCGLTSLLWNRDYNLEVQSDFRVASVQEVLKILSAASLPLERIPL